MNEQELEKKFIDFLVNEKGYPPQTLLRQSALYKHTGEYPGYVRRYIADLVIIDSFFNEYLALIEFSSSNSAIESHIGQVRTYLDAMRKENIPAYLISSEGNSDFNIFLLGNNQWKLIDKDEFPRYESLSSKNQADEKSKHYDAIQANKKEYKRRVDLIKSTSWATLTSLIIGILVSIVFYGNSLFKKMNVDKVGTNTNCCDSIGVFRDKINAKILLLENSINGLKVKDSITFNNVSNTELQYLNQRIGALENIVNQSPEKLLKLQELTYQIRDLKTLIDNQKAMEEIKITSLKDRIDQLTAWTSGLIITIIGSIIGFALVAIKKN